MGATAIIAAVAGLAPAFDSDLVPSARYGEGIKDTLRDDDLPVRMIFAAEDGSYHQFIALGRTYKMTWEIVDRLFIKPLAAGQGRPEWEAKIAAYMDSYVSLIQTNRQIVSQCIIISARFAPHEQDFQGNVYSVLDVVLTIEEYRGG